jgi:histidyl-tRNA synthetase
VETPAIEYTDALGKFLPDQDRPNEGVFSFQDDDEQWLSLRYDLTAPLARYVAENFDHLPKPYRSYRFGWVFRNEKPGPGRFRQFMQFDADTVGSASMAADAEVCMMIADTMERLGIPRSQYVVKVNSRKILDGIMEEMGLTGDQNAMRRLTILRAIDKRDRIGDDGVRALLGEGRKDESGDFTKGAGLLDTTIDALLRFVTPAENTVYSLPTKDSDESDDDNHWIDASNLPLANPPPKELRVYFDNERLLDHWDKLFETSKIGREAISELRQIIAVGRAAGYGSKRLRIDPSVVRGLEYYTGPVYEVELLIETKDEKGRPVRFGSVGGGGRYDGLVSRFRGEPVPATGFSIGVSRLQAALDLIDKAEAKAEYGPVVVTVFGGEIAHYQKMVATLRNAGIRAELYLGNPKHGMGQQLKYADRRNSPCAIIQGSDEKARNEILIKDLKLGATLTDTADRDAYLKKQAQAQFAVKEDNLVEAVREVLARHGVK